MRNTLSLVLLSAIILFAGCSNGSDDNTIEASGNIEAINVVVSSKTSGEIIKLLKDEGTLIYKGDTVLIIDHENLDIQLRQAIAAYDAAVAQFDLLKKGARTEDIKQSEEQLNQAKVNFELTEKDYERMQNLYNSNSITKKQFEDASARYDIAKAQLTSAQENYKKINNLARPEELRQAQANAQNRLSAVDLLKKNISDCYITSPIDGFIVKKFVEVGESVAPMTSLFKVSDLNEVDLVIYVPESELGKVKLGNKAEISTDAYPDKKYESVVNYISPEAEFTPKNIQTKEERTKLVFAVKLKAKNPDFELKPGMPADAVIKLEN